MFNQPQSMWAVHVGQDKDGYSHQHLIPEADIRKHDLSPNCICSPTEHNEHADAWEHNSFDGREAYEYGRRKPH